jgi:hypothetical protein
MSAQNASDTPQSIAPQPAGRLIERARLALAGILRARTLPLARLLDPLRRALIARAPSTPYWSAVLTVARYLGVVARRGTVSRRFARNAVSMIRASSFFWTDCVPRVIAHGIASRRDGRWDLYPHMTLLSCGRCLPHALSKAG